MTRKDSPSEAPTLPSGWEASTIARDREGAQEVSIANPALAPLDFAQRYLADQVLGEGGMGTVRVYLDQQIGRRIAMKVIRSDHPPDPHARLRFVREAMLQGQLEHPSVVPVYDLGVDPDGAAYFTMKRVHGVTLADIVDGLRARPAEFAGPYSRRRLLTAFSSVCLAINFAHERGVLHRDLKPGNIMLGHYGEVYVLDWGVARLRGPADDAPSPPIRIDPVPTQRTRAGALLGTPGYMSPEQARGEHATAGPASDVYALGAILFELLALKPLHEGHTVEQLIHSTLRGADVQFPPCAPEQDVPVELEQIVVKATALDPAARYPSARALQDEIERYLDGERDTERRAQQAEIHARAAVELAERARTERDARFEYRRHAMREIGRALALDPDSGLATDALMKLLAQPPPQLPPEVETELEQSNRDQIRRLARIGGFTYLSLFVYLPFFLWSGVRDWRWVVALYALAIATSAVSFWTGRRREPSNRGVLAVMVLSNATLATTAALFGAVFVTPAILAVNTMAFTLHLRRRHRVYAIATGCGTMLLLLGLQMGGLLPGGYVFGPAGMTVTPGAIDLPRLPTLVFLSVVAVGTVLTAALPITRVREAMAEMEQRVYVYTWHLREMVPEAIRGPTDPSVSRDRSHAA